MSSLQEQAKSVFDQALEIDCDKARESYLAQKFQECPQIRARVEGLLKAYGEAGSFLESPAVGIDDTIEDSSLREAPGKFIGPYKLRERVGAGGMGVVWAAEQKQPLRRKVALKVIKPGMDSQAVIARFEAEREALALMDHPNIARVLDAGTTDQGRPYFVMELIRGMPITEYCDSFKLNVRQRLELFIQICSAVKHAHQKGIIHRDIKPSNVLVTEHDGTPLPKVIDFGVAKALHQPLTERSIYTGIQQAIGTLAYMSPEQAALSARDVDTRVDIYGLGVLLYELLTGVTPFDRKQLEQAAVDEACRIIREQDPPKPSTKLSTLGASATAISLGRGTDPRVLGRTIRGDLDWIVMKALEKDRSRRYETAAAFAADVQHYLEDEAVQARPPSSVYRLRKFARKHRVEFSALILVTAVLLTALVGVSWLARSRTAERDRANMLVGELEQQRDLAERLLRELSDRIVDAGVTDIMGGNHEAAKEKIAGLESINARDLAAQLNTYMLIKSGEYEKSIEFLRPAVNESPKSVAYHALLALLYDRIGNTDGSLRHQRILDQLPSKSFTDDRFQTLRPDYFAWATPDKVERLTRMLASRPSPSLMLSLANAQAETAMYTGQVELVEEALQQLAAAKVMLGVRSGEVRFRYLKGALAAASALRVQGRDWREPLKAVEDVVAAIEVAPTPIRHERSYLAAYYYEIGEHKKALDVRRELLSSKYLVLAVESGIEIDPEHLATFAQRSTAGTRSRYAWYLFFHGKLTEADEACLSPQSLRVVTAHVNLLLAAGRQPKAREVARAALDRVERADFDDTVWGSFLETVYLPAVADEWDDDRLLAAARKSTYSQWASGTSHFLLGLRHYANEDSRLARDHFQQCIDRSVYRSDQRIWSRMFLRKLGATAIEYNPGAADL